MSNKSTARPVIRSRAAILCFGDWGLQTMLHVWPRLRLAQEMRAALQIADALPDLDRLTGFAAILPQVAGEPDGAARLSCQVLKPNPEHYPPPFYLEQQLAQAAELTPEGAPPELAGSEPATARLLRSSLALQGLLAHLRSDGHVHPLALERLPDVAGPPSRTALFQFGMEAAGTIADALLSQVIDPTRFDSVQTHDPFVQTTIYVVASLAEPLASPLLWPILSELAVMLGSRHMAKTVALLSTGAFAQDATRTVEDASVYVALNELEFLTGIRAQDRDPDTFRQLVSAASRNGWEQRVGRKLFDRVYLLDREKSNQALAQSAHELSILVGNALEAFLVADGDSLIEQRLGPELDTGQPGPYSVLGAANDYVPLAEYITAAIEEEQRHIVQAEILAEPDQPADGAATLADLGVTPQNALDRFLGAARRSLFEPAKTGGMFELAVTQQHIFPEALVRELNRTRAPEPWLALVEKRQQEVASEIEGTYAAAVAAWGCGNGVKPYATPADDLQETAAPVPVDSCLVPSAAGAALDRIVSDIAAAPQGILKARHTLTRWLEETEAVLGELERGFLPVDQEYRQRQEVDRWRQEFIAAINEHPAGPLTWLRPGAAGLLAALLILGWLLMGSGPAFSPSQWTAVVVVCGLLPVGLALGGWMVATQQMRQLKRRRLLMVQQHLTRAANRLLQRGVYQTYRDLHEELGRLAALLEDTITELANWARGDGLCAGLPAGINQVPLRTARRNDQLWQKVRQSIQEKSAEGQHSREAFRRIWQADSHAVYDWSRGGKSLVRSIRAALETQATLLRPAGQEQRRAAPDRQTLSRVYHHYLAQATGYLCAQQRLLADHADLVREAAGAHGIEPSLFGEVGAAADVSSLTQLDYVEDIYTRARTSANYEVTYTFSTDVVEVAFGVTPEGQGSRLQRVAEQRNLPLLASRNPLAISLIRSVNRLALPELTLSERCHRQYQRLSEAEREHLTIAAPAEPNRTLSGQQPMETALH